MRLLLLRHGQTESNVIGALDTAVPGAPLNELGLRQAAAVPGAFSALEISTLRSLMLYEPPYVATGARPKPAPAILEEIERLLAAGDPDAALAIAMRESVGMSDAEIDSLRRSSGWEHLRAAARAIPYDWALWENQPSPEALAAKFSNFHFHLALSSPLPETTG